MASRKVIEAIRSESGAEGLAGMARELGYRSRFGQLQFNNGATASDLFEFFQDNPGAVDAVLTWVLDEGRDSDGNELSDEDEDEETDEDEEDEG
jgi:hypothetical protein